MACIGELNWHNTINVLFDVKKNWMGVTDMNMACQCGCGSAC